jgi:hypothetical protein
MPVVINGTTGITTPDLDSTADITANSVPFGEGGGSVTTNTAAGIGSLNSNTSGSANTALGNNALNSNTTGNDNTAIGRLALLNATTGSGNTAVGENSGNAITTGAKNTILGRFNGNQGGLDIRGGNNYIVLSDGDGDPVIFTDPVNGNLDGRYLIAGKTLGSSTNLNTIFKSGTYRVDSGATNTPTATFYALLVFGNGGNVTTQLATVIAGTNTYVRSFNSSWSAWVQIG